MTIDQKKELLEFLYKYKTDNKVEAFEKVINYRTRHLTVVLEDIYQSHNASAVVRTCDIYGVQDLHIIENVNKYTINPKVVMGSAKWVDMHRHNKRGGNTVETLQELKKQGYRIVATSPHSQGYSIHDLPLDQKIALCFGTELTGLSDEALALADDYVTIPMYGFTESFNISVSAAICLSHLTKRLHDSEVEWQLNEEQKLDLLIDWTVKCLNKGDVVKKEFLKNHLQK